MCEGGCAESRKKKAGGGENRQSNMYSKNRKIVSKRAKGAKRDERMGDAMRQQRRLGETIAKRIASPKMERNRRISKRKQVETANIPTRRNRQHEKCRRGN